MSAKRRTFAAPAGVVLAVLAIAFLLANSLLFAAQAQANPASATSNASVKPELPVTMRESLVAGKTAVGTKVETKLTMATLLNRVVIPEGAILSGEVIESRSMSGGELSRLAIRVDLAKWKDGSTPLKAYLTAWYYPPPPMNVEEVGSSHGPVGGFNFPRRPVDEAPEPTVNRTKLKDIEMERLPDGRISLTSSHSDIKLDKVTVYVLAVE
jgi:hypothetical protein